MAGVLGLLGEAGLSIGAVEVIIHGTTLATNAIIERKGAATALIATDGFRDTLAIADEGRYGQYDINIDKPTPLVPRALRFTVPDRTRSIFGRSAQRRPRPSGGGKTALRHGIAGLVAVNGGAI